jgi:hypothetical protein
VRESNIIAESAIAVNCFMISSLSWLNIVI